MLYIVDRCKGGYTTAAPKYQKLNQSDTENHYLRGPIENQTDDVVIMGVRI